MAVDGVCSKPFSWTRFPANREKYREIREIVLGTCRASAPMLLNIVEFRSRYSDPTTELNRELSPRYQGNSFP